MDKHKAKLVNDYLTKEVMVDNQKVNLQVHLCPFFPKLTTKKVWDTAGMEKFHSNGKNMYLRKVFTRDRKHLLQRS